MIRVVREGEKGGGGTGGDETGYERRKKERMSRGAGLKGRWEEEGKVKDSKSKKRRGAGGESGA